MNTEVGSCWDEAPFGPGQSNGLLCELPSGHAGAHRAGDAEWMIRGPQGEPSDAQVEAGCAAFYEGAQGLTSWTRIVAAEPDLANRYRDGIRAALRAAGAVR